MDLLVDRSTSYLLQKILQAVSFLIGFDIQNMDKLVYLEIKLKYIHIKLIRKFTKNKGFYVPSSIILFLEMNYESFGYLN